MTRAAVALLALLAAAPAAAQPAPNRCGPHDGLAPFLADGWGEVPVAVMLDTEGRLVEMFANLETGTWAVVVTAPSGTACMVSDGDNYEPVEPPPQGAPA